MAVITGNVFRQTPPGTPTNKPDGSLSVNDASIGITGFVVTNTPGRLSGSRKLRLEGSPTVMQRVVSSRSNLLTLTGTSLGLRVPPALGPFSSRAPIEYFRVTNAVYADTGKAAVAVKTVRVKSGRKAVIVPTTMEEEMRSGRMTVEPPRPSEPVGPFRDPVLRQEANTVGCVGCGPAFEDKSGVATVAPSFSVVAPEPMPETLAAGLGAQPFSPFLSQIVLGLPLWIWLVGGAVLLSTREKG